MKITKYSDSDNSRPDFQFIEDYPFASDLLKYVDSVSNGNAWFIQECFENSLGECWVTFGSYDVPEYMKFALVIVAKPSASGWSFSIQEQITELS